MHERAGGRCKQDGQDLQTLWQKHTQFSFIFGNNSHQQPQPSLGCRGDISRLHTTNPAGASDGTHPPGRADQLSDLEPQWILPPCRHSELGWNRRMCGYRIHVKHPVRIDGLETTTSFGPTKSIAKNNSASMIGPSSYPGKIFQQCAENFIAV